MFSQLDTIDANGIAEIYFGGSTGRFVHQQKEHGRFPRESYKTPGLRGRCVWLRETCDVWLAEYLHRVGDGGDTTANNDAAVTATRIAEAHDKKLRQAIINNRHAGSVPTRERKDARLLSSMAC